MVLSANAENSPADTRIDRVYSYVKSRFDKNYWFGSLISLSAVYRSYQNLLGAFARQVNGEKQPDKLRAVNYSIFTAVNSWSFLSQRGGKFPEGRTLLQRIGNTLKHPHQSSTQFEYLLSLAPVTLGIYNNLEKGLKAHGVGVSARETAYTAEKVRLYTGLLSIVRECFLGYGHFIRPNKSKRPVFLA